MKISVQPDSLKTAQFCLASIMVISIIAIYLLYESSIVAALASSYPLVGSLALLISIKRRRIPPFAFVVLAIGPAAIFVPIGTVATVMAVRNIYHEDTRAYCAGNWRPTREALAKIRRDLAEDPGLAYTLLMVFGGGCVGFFVTALACLLHSPEAVQTGWIICIFTIPLGMSWGISFGRSLIRKRLGGEPCLHCGYRIGFRTKTCPSCYGQIKMNVRRSR